MRQLTDSLLAAQKKPDRLPYVEAKVYDFEQGIQRLSWTRLYEGSEPDNHHGIAFDGQGSMHRIRVEEYAEPAWQASTAYSLGDFVWPTTPNGFRYECTTAGTSGTTEPSWPITPGDTVADGTVVWTCRDIRYHLYRQKITNPDENSDYSNWELATSDCAGPCAIAAYGSKVYIFYRRTDNTIRKYYSHNYGADWTNAELSTCQDATSMAAAWWGTSSKVVCVVANSVILHCELNAIVLDTDTQVASEYPHSEPSTNSLWDIYGLGITFAVSPERMCIIFAAGKSDYPYHIYALFRTELSDTYGWLAWQYFATAPEAEGLKFQYPDVHLPASPQPYEWFQMTAVEAFSGTISYNRPLRFHAVRASEFSEMAYSEPKPFLNLTSDYGLRTSSTSDYWWMERPDGVWRAPRAAGDPLDLTQDIITLTQTMGNVVRGFSLVLELDNHSGKYANPGVGDIAKLKKRSEVVLKLGYKTTAGDEASQAGVYWIDGWEYFSTDNRSLFTLYCLDGWGLSDRWLARTQLRWNFAWFPVLPETVWHLIKRMLCRWGICLCNLCNRSTAINSLKPEFIVNPGQPGDAAVRRLLAMVPDLLDYQRYYPDIDYTVASTKEPRGPDHQYPDQSCYEYKFPSPLRGEGQGEGALHPILAGDYRLATPLTHARAIGRAADDSKIIASSFDWDNLQLAIDNFQPDYDPNLENADRAQERADAILRKHALEAMGGQITVPVNCGQELYDVITVTDERCGISAQKYRVMAIEADYSRREARYTQRLTLASP